MDQKLQANKELDIFPVKYNLTAVPQVILPKITIRVPKEFQKSVDAAFSSTEPEYSEDEECAVDSYFKNVTFQTNSNSNFSTQFFNEGSASLAMSNENDTQAKTLKHENSIMARVCRRLELTKVAMQLLKQKLQHSPRRQRAASYQELANVRFHCALDDLNPVEIVRICLAAVHTKCSYCNHARRIAVNGRSLVLHMIAQHRFNATVNSRPAEELTPDTFAAKLKTILPILEIEYFNLESYCTMGEGVFTRQVNERVFECLLCCLKTSTHKELNLHNRKKHLKTSVLCYMCRINFFSFSELICHLCPGVSNKTTYFDIKFRCCLCAVDNIPSNFRLMVHLRKRHAACEICLEDCHEQSRIALHVSQHKQPHFCYRCGLVFPNKMVFSKHLFFKHDTESMSCNRCLQKRWPHVYHFCMSATAFVCDVCDLCFPKAVNLKVHKRLHSKVFPYSCTEEQCTQKFVSRKLLQKHAAIHEFQKILVAASESMKKEVEISNKECCNVITTDYVLKGKSKFPDTNINDEFNREVFDLEALDLSESDSSDDSTGERKPRVKLLPSPKGDNAKINKLEAEDRNKFVSKSKIKVEKFDTRNHSALLGCPRLMSSNQRYSEIPPPALPPIPKNKDTVITSPKNLGPVLQTVQRGFRESCLGSNIDLNCPSGSSNISSSSVISNESDSSDSSNVTRNQNNSESERNRALQEIESESVSLKHITSQAVNTVNEKKEVELNKNMTISSNPPSDPYIYESDLETNESESEEEYYDEHPQQYASELFGQKRPLKHLLPTRKVVILENSLQSTNILSVSAREKGSIPDMQNMSEESNWSEEEGSLKRSKRARHSSESYRCNNYGIMMSNILNQSSLITMRPPKSQPLQLNWNKEDLPASSKNVRKYVRKVPHIPKESSAALKRKHDNAKNSAQIYVTKSSTQGDLSPIPKIKIRLSIPPDESDQMDTSAVGKCSPVNKAEENAENSSSSFDNNQEPIMNIRRLRSTINVADTNQPTPVRSRAKQPPPKSAAINRKTPLALLPNPDNKALIYFKANNIRYPVRPPAGARKAREGESVYCYCRCPYDEVAEMIACDGAHCMIEWFHFECVGIMVAPQGNWFCPECRPQYSQELYPKNEEADNTNCTLK